MEMDENKRFIYDKPVVAFSKGGIYDATTDKCYEFTMDTVLDLLNELNKENQYLKSLKWNQDCINEIGIGMQQRQALERENEEVHKAYREEHRKNVRLMETIHHICNEHNIDAKYYLEDLE